MLNFVYNDGTIVQMSSAVLITLTVITGLVMIAFYLLRSLGVYKLSVRANLKSPWLAFIPIAWIYLAGKLAGNVAFFGNKIKNFALLVLIVFGVVEIAAFAINFLTYFPLVGYALTEPNAKIYYSMGSFTLLGTYQTQVDPYIATAHKLNFSYLYSNTAKTLFSIGNIIVGILAILEAVLVISLYLNLFRRYYPRHYVMAGILSYFGLFAPFIFAVRNNNPVNYAEYMRSRYNYYNPYGNPYGGNPYGGNPYGGAPRREEPFGEDSKTEEEKKPPEEPFGDLGEKK